MGNRKEWLGGSLNWCGRKRRMAMGNRKERLGVTKLVRKKAENGNVEP